VRKIDPEFLKRHGFVRKIDPKNFSFVITIGKPVILLIRLESPINAKGQ